MQWPDLPSPAKIRYVGELAAAEDLRPAKGFFQPLGELFLGKAKTQSLYGPRGVACTADAKRVFVADPGGRCLHVLELETRQYHKVTSVAETPLLSPVAVCAGPDGVMLVADSEATAIHEFSDSDGRWLRSLRLPEELHRPAGLAYDAEEDELYVADSTAHDLKVLDRKGALKRILGQRGTGPGEFNFPCDLAFGNGVLWVADAGNHRVQGLKPSGEWVAEFGRAGDAPGDIALPKGIALDSEGHLYVVDSRFENVQVFDATGQLLIAFGEEGSGPGQFWLPSGITIDAHDRIWVCDGYNRRLQVFEYVKQP